MPKSGSRFRLSDRRLIAFAVEALLLLGLAFLLARFIFFIGFGASGSDFQIDAFSVNTRSAQSGGLSAVPGQTNFTALFADRSVQVEVSEQADIVPETQLQLVLRGIRRGTEPSNGAALIQLANAQQVFVSAGDEISDGVELREVHTDYVIISRRGIREGLRIREASARSTVTGADGEDATAAASAPPRERPIYTAAQIGHAIARPGDRHDVAGMFLVEPRYIDDAIVGLAFAGGNTNMLETIGLRMGDIVTEIDGRPISNPDEIQALLDDLRGDDRVDVSIVRNGMSLNLSVDLP